MLTYIQVESSDLIPYGLIPEFVGRFPILVNLLALTENQLIQLLTELKNALGKQYKKLFQMNGIPDERDGDDIIDVVVVDEEAVGVEGLGCGAKILYGKGALERYLSSNDVKDIEEEDDTNYVEGEAADVFDSDFNSDEPKPEEETDNEPDERWTRKKLVFPGKPKPSFQTKPKPGFPGKPRLGFPGKEIPKKKQKKVVSETDTSNGEDTNPEQSKSTPQDDHDEPDDTEVEKTTRKSTRTAVVVRQAERDATRAALQATMKPIKRKKEGEEKKITQEEMLLEAAQTEIMNLRNLEQVQAREEEVKKRAIVHKAVYTGPQIRYISKDVHCISRKAVCVVTGLPAKYRDPKTGLPYATKEAFKIIHERHASNSSGIKEKNSMGELYDLTSQEGFAKKKKRSINPNMRENSYLRSSGQFYQIPAFEDLDSD